MSAALYEAVEHRLALMGDGLEVFGRSSQRDRWSAVEGFQRTRHTMHKACSGFALRPGRAVRPYSWLPWGIKRVLGVTEVVASDYRLAEVSLLGSVSYLWQVPLDVRTSAGVPRRCRVRILVCCYIRMAFHTSRFWAAHASDPARLYSDRCIRHCSRPDIRPGPCLDLARELPNRGRLDRASHLVQSLSSWLAGYRDVARTALRVCHPEGLEVLTRA